MSFQSVSILSYFPAESMNHRIRCEERWNDDAKASVYGDNQWQISLKNGKRLNRHWTRCGGMTFINDQRGITRTIYNENYDVEWQKAKYDRSFQPDGDEDFYTKQLQEQRLHDKEIAYIRTGKWEKY